MYKERFEDFHDIAVGCKKKNPSKNTIKLAKKYILPNQDKTTKITVIVNKRKEITVERNIRFDENQKEFYIFYDCSKYWIRPVSEPLNYDDPALYEWTIF
jgi:hypothetical protein